MSKNCDDLINTCKETSEELEQYGGDTDFFNL